MKRKQAGTPQDGPEHHSKRPKSAATSIFDKLSEELTFHCLSYLGHADLLAVSEANKYLSRVASDNQLWKALYARAYLDQQEEDNAWFKRDDSLPTRTWKGLFRIAHNWKVGRARTTRLPLRSAILPKISLETELDGPEGFDVEEPAIAGSSSSLAQEKPTSQARKQQDDTKVVWHGQHYFVASKNISEEGLPSVEIFEITASSGSPQKVATVISTGLKGKGSPGSLSITEMQLDAEDHGTDGIRLAVFYSNGQFSLFRVRGTGHGTQDSVDIREEYFHATTSSRPIIMARLHSPILVTSTSDCSVRFRLLEEQRDSSTGATQLTLSTAPPTMRTSLCFAPMTMRLTRKHLPASGFARLKAQQAPQRFQLSLAYSTPYYPAAFTVALQVFNITVPPKSKGSKIHQRRLEVFARSAIAVPPSSAVPGEQNQSMVNTIEHDGPYIVASRSDNTISVYKVIDGLADSWLSQSEAIESVAPSPAKLHAAPLKLRHVRTLFGHTSAVDAVSLLDGRCVSTGRDGIKVWELPLGKDARYTLLASSESDVEDDSRWRSNIPISERNLPQIEDASSRSPSHAPSKCRWIGLDTSRIVTVSQEEGGGERCIKVYHFE